jgi:hypothetical protein
MEDLSAYEELSPMEDLGPPISLMKIKLYIIRGLTTGKHYVESPTT